jgi:ribosomal protein L44E
MPPLYKKKHKNQSIHTIQCKDCGSIAQRVQRTFFEKFVSLLSSGKYAHEKYYCKACDTYTFRSINATARKRKAVADEAGAN